MGAATFGTRYCKDLPEDFAARIINTYRRQWAPAVPKLWNDLERAALRAMQLPGRVVTADCGIQYKLETKAGLPFLVCRLLNEKEIHYFDARVEERETPRGLNPVLVYRAYKNKQWRNVKAWGGHLVENTVQALARELLVDAMFRFEARGYPIVLTCHDEIVVEHPDVTEEIVAEIMSEVSPWAVELDLPIAVEAWVGRRYRK